MNFFTWKTQRRILIRAATIVAVVTILFVIPAVLITYVATWTGVVWFLAAMFYFLSAVVQASIET